MTEMVLTRPTALRLADALWRSRGPHTARLVDVASLDDGLVGVEVEEGARPLLEMLGDRLSLGAAVTILVPLADCIEALGRSGVVHDGIGVEAVSLDSSGAPVLGGFGSAHVPDRPGDDPFSRDRSAYRELASAVLEAVGDDPRVGRAIDGLAGLPGERDRALATFAECLLAIAEPEPVPMRVPSRPPGSATLAAAGPGRSRARVRPARDAPATLATRPAAVERASGLAGAVRGSVRRLGHVRPRFWVLAGLIAVALLGALLLLPQEGAAPQPAPSDDGGLGAAVLRREETVRPPDDPVEALLALRPEALGAAVVDDYGDVVLLSLQTRSGSTRVLLERTELGWRVRDTLPETPAPAPSDAEVRRELPGLEPRLDRRQEASRVRAIDDPVVVGEREVDE